MVTDKPPRRTKSSKEPVTIDATASKAEVVAEPVRSNDLADNGASFGADTAAAEATTAMGENDASTETPSDPDVATPPEEPLTNKTVTEEGERAAEIAAAADASEIDDPPTSTAEETSSYPRPPAARTERRSPATSTLVAAGVVGGIVALALAGSMQYAGYLPNGGSTDTGATEELAALRQQVEELGQNRGPDPDLQARIQALEAAASEDTGSDTTEQIASFQQGLASFEQKLGALEQELSTIRSAAETFTTESAGRLDQVQQRLDALQARVDEPGPERAAARAISAAGLKAATDQGGPFESQLEAFAAVAPDDPAVARLQPYAGQGVPTQAQLVERFSQLSNEIIEAVAQPDPDQGIASRLMSSAISVVKVRRTGEVDGDTPEAAVSRIEEGLRSGNLDAASSAWETLPEEGKAVSQDFKEALDARIAVDGLIGDTVSRAVSETANQN